MEEMKQSEQQQDRVRSYTVPQLTKRVDQDTQECLRALAGADNEVISQHLEQFSQEWDVERYLQTNASILTLAGLVLSATKSKKWLLVPAVVLPFLLQHGLQGWCPPLNIFRRMGVRTSKEINRERYALKALRGDFAPSSGAANQPSKQRNSKVG
jgi:hypothetical protein